MSTETVNSRREARRKKILENSENRLSRITGKSNVKSNPDFVFVREHGLTNEDHVPKRVSSFVESNENCLYFNSKTTKVENPSTRISSESSDINISSPSTAQPSENETLSPSSMITTDQYKPLVFILSAILFRISIEFDIHHICACSMVLAFALAEMGVIVVQGLPAFDSSQFLASLLLLSGISHRKIKAFIVFNTLLSIFLKDFALFTFAFVTTHITVTWCKHIF